MLSSFDIYGRQVSFVIAGKNTFQTNLGCFLTVLTLGFVVFCCFVFGADLYYRENPNVVDQTIQPLDTTPLYFNPRNYTMVFSFGDDYFNFNPDGYFDISISYEYIDNYNSTKQSQPIELRRCTQNDMRNYLKLYQQGDFFCFDVDGFSLNGSWTENYLSRIKFAVNRCQNKSGSPIVCKSDQEISQKVQNDVYFNIFTEDNSVNMNDYRNPISNSIKDLYWLLDNQLGKHVEVYLKKVTLETDDGLLLRSLSSQFAYKFEHYDLDVVSNSDPINRNYPFIKLVLYASSHTQQIQRIYPKAQFVAAEVSGSVKIFSICCVGILSMYTRYLLTIFLIESEFDNTRKRRPEKKQQQEGGTHAKKITSNGNNDKVRLNFGLPQLIEYNNQNENNNKEIPKIGTRINPRNNKTLTLEKFKKTSFPENDQNCPRFEEATNQKSLSQKKDILLFDSKAKLKNAPSKIEIIPVIRKRTQIDQEFLTRTRRSTIKQKLEDLNPQRKLWDQFSKDHVYAFTFWDFLKSKYCLSFCVKRQKNYSKKLKMFQKAQTTISSYFDARILIRKFIEIERMKKLLFTEEQLKVYELLGKPKLFCEKEEKGKIFNLKDMVPGFFHLTQKKLDAKIQAISNFSKSAILKKKEMMNTDTNRIDLALYNMLEEDLKERIVGKSNGED